MDTHVQKWMFAQTEKFGTFIPTAANAQIQHIGMVCFVKHILNAKVAKLSTATTNVDAR